MFIDLSKPFTLRTRFPAVENFVTFLVGIHGDHQQVQIADVDTHQWNAGEGDHE